MKTIIAGSRDFKDWNKFIAHTEKIGWNITSIVSGGARGVDKLGENFARAVDIPLHIMKADWEKNGKSAGYIRNGEMADYADSLVALWDGESKGTKNMIEQAMRKKLSPILIIII